MKHPFTSIFVKASYRRLSRMSLLCSISRVSPYTAQRTLAPALRTLIQQRFASNIPKLEGPLDNAFNRERLAVKAHAAESAGTILAEVCTMDIEGLHIDSDLWRKLCI